MLLIRFPDRINFSTEHFIEEDSVVKYATNCIPIEVQYEWVKTDTSGAVAFDSDGNPELEMKTTTHHDLLWKVATTDGKLLAKKKTWGRKALRHLATQLKSMNVT
jgi:hypothetical protein